MIFFVGNKLIGSENYQLASVEECLEYCNKLEWVGVDTETEGFDVHTCGLLSLQLGDFNNQYVIDLKVIDIQCFKELLETKNLIFQNAKFDLKFLFKQNIWPNENLYDTFLGELVITTGIEERGLSLKELCNKYCGVDLDKTVRGDIHKEGLSDKVIVYAANDIKYLEQIKDKQFIRINEQQLNNTISLENKHILALAYIEYCGFKLDTELWKENAKNNRVKLASKDKELTQWLIDNNLTKYLSNQIDLFSEEVKANIQWSSPKQVAKFFQDLGIDTKVRDKKTGKEKNSVEAKHIEKFKKKSTFIPLYLDYKEIEKQISTYGDKFLNFVNPVTKRIHSDFFPILNTGRTSSNKPNIQNITADESVRKCFVADRGNTLVIGDFASQEPRCLAALSNDSKLIDFFANGDGDIHSLVASNMYSVIEGRPVKITKADYAKRQLGKILGLKLNYGGTAYTVKDDLGVDIKEAEKFVKAYEQAFPEKEEYFKQSIQFAKANGYILTNNIDGRRIYIDFYKRWRQLINMSYEEKSKEEFREYAILSGKLERMAKNYRIQGTAGSQTKLACIYIYRAIRTKYPQVKMVAAIHDEIILETPEEISNEIAGVLKIEMEKAANLIANNPKVYFKSEVNINKFWKK